MATTYTKIETVTVGAGGASSISFTSIPNTYTDLCVKVSTRSNLDYASGGAAVEIKLNSTGASSYRRLESNGTTASSDSAYQYANAVPNNFTANTFGNTEFYIPNYLSSNNKSVSVDSVGENNATLTANSLNALLFSVTTAVTSLSISPFTGYNFLQYTTATLYGVTNASTAATKKATGGDIITTSGGYTYHAFLTSGTFTPTQSLSADILVIAGGGGGAGGAGGGGGAGGLLAHTSQSLTATGYTVTVGGGGATNVNGSNSQFASLTASVGGGKGGDGANGSSGGSGGGAGSNGVRSGGAGTSGQGNAGGGSTSSYPNDSGGGGGSAAAVGGDGGTSGQGGQGANGSSTYSSWAIATTTGQNVSGTSYYAGGGSGYGRNASPQLSGGAGGGGRADGSSGLANTGGGGGALGGAGGSGIVIVRYAV